MFGKLPAQIREGIEQGAFLFDDVQQALLLFATLHPDAWTQWADTTRLEEQREKQLEAEKSKQLASILPFADDQTRELLLQMTKGNMKQ